MNALKRHGPPSHTHHSLLRPDGLQLPENGVSEQQPRVSGDSEKNMVGKRREQGETREKVEIDKTEENRELCS